MNFLQQLLKIIGFNKKETDSNNIKKETNLDNIKKEAEQKEGFVATYTVDDLSMINSAIVSSLKISDTLIYIDSDSYSDLEKVKEEIEKELDNLPESIKEKMSNKIMFQINRTINLEKRYFISKNYTLFEKVIFIAVSNRELPINIGYNSSYSFILNPKIKQPN